MKPSAKRALLLPAWLERKLYLRVAGLFRPVACNRIMGCGRAAWGLLGPCAARLRGWVRLRESRQQLLAGRLSAGRYGAEGACKHSERTSGGTQRMSERSAAWPPQRNGGDGRHRAVGGGS